jgi:enoyl-CoA hydratase/carnithine racemase
MELENILIENKGHVALLTINHPPANAWNLATMQDMEKALDALEADKNVRVVIITGSGEKCFSAGFDVSDAGNAGTTAPLGRTLWRRIDRFSKPVIAAINGFALGGGLELALACHFRFMVDAPKATVGLTELNLGIIPGWGGTQRLAAVVGKARALDMIFFSKKVGAKEAYEMGLINHVSEMGKVVDDALAFAETLAKRPPIAVSCVLKALSAGQYEGIDQGLAIEAEGSDKVATTMDCIEGFTAFMEKREPVFKGE